MRIFVLIIFVLVPVELQAEGMNEFFENKVRPLLHEHCAACHGEKLQAAQIDFRKPETVLGKVVTSGDESSSLIRAVRYESTIKMPPGTKLPEEAIDTLVEWVRLGAPWPDYEPAQQDLANLIEEVPESDHWSFQPPADPAAPQVENAKWVRNEIDHFILARIEEKGLQPATQADKSKLLRRAHFDLLGLPPSEQEIQDFLADKQPDAFKRLVEKLLDSPHYGERWGRHWLDVARYADSTGVDEDHPFGDSWRYRDYVVNAFNEDLPFTQFVREQIAGDLLPAPAGESLNKRGIIGTGFLALGPKALAQRDPVQKKYDVVDEQIDTTSKAFLGLTIACARCHDHKFDPILTSDYYALAGIMASTKSFVEWQKNGSRYYKHPLVETAVYEEYKTQFDAIQELKIIQTIARRNARTRYILEGPGKQIANYFLSTTVEEAAQGLDPETTQWFREYLAPRPSPRPYLANWRKTTPEQRKKIAMQYQDEFLRTLNARLEQADPWLEQILHADEVTDSAGLGELPTSLLYRDLVDDNAPFDLEVDDIKDQFEPQDKELLRRVDQRIERSNAALPQEPPLANSVAEDESIKQRIFQRGQHKNQGALVAKRFPLVLAGVDQPAVKTVSGRLELANWLVSENNPLTARVIVNRVWLWHFGEGLVRTPNNFGLRGEEPTHPELLDWLAVRLVEGGWSIKNLHRLIMNSATYQMSSQITPEAWDKDVENRLWSRFQRRRLTIEELRDSYLNIGGKLDLTVGGNLDADSGKLVEFDRNNRRINPDDYQRRSVYLPLMRNKLPTLLGLFDFGDATTANGKRSVTNVAPQALYLLNSEFVQSCAESLSERLEGSDQERINRGFQVVFARNATPAENTQAMHFIQSHSKNTADAASPLPGSWSNLYKLMLASNEFHYVD